MIGRVMVLLVQQLVEKEVLPYQLVEKEVLP